jgi:hypothetical protein
VFPLRWRGAPQGRGGWLSHTKNHPVRLAPATPPREGNTKTPPFPCPAGAGGIRGQVTGGLCFPSAGGVPRRGGVVGYRTQKPPRQACACHPSEGGEYKDTPICLPRRGGGDQGTGDRRVVLPLRWRGAPQGRGGYLSRQKTTPSGLRLPPLRGRGIQGHPHLPAPQGRGWVLGFLFLDRPLPC